MATRRDRGRGRDRERDRVRDRSRERDRERHRERDREREHHSRDRGGEKRDSDRGRSDYDRDRRRLRGKTVVLDQHKKHLDKLMSEPVSLYCVCVLLLCFSELKVRCTGLCTVVSAHAQDKPVNIPEPAKDKKPPEPPEFVRFYMGELSSMLLSRTATRAGLTVHCMPICCAGQTFCEST